jgi:antirestriction protein ArdC
MKKKTLTKQGRAALMRSKHRNNARTTSAERAASVAVLTDKLHSSVAELTTSEAWTRMLETAARFQRYSARNMLLLLIQAEERGTEITRVAGYRTWQTLGRQVRRGEKSYEVLAPVRHRLSLDEAAERAAAGEPAYDAEGRPIMVVGGFRIEHVFDVSQTDGEQLATMPGVPYLAGDGPAGLWDAVAELITEAGFEIIRGTLADGVRGETNYTNRIVTVGDELPPAEAAHILTHELGHIAADHEHRHDISRAQRETEADSIAYVVCSALGLDVGEKATFYVAQWSKGDPAILEESVAVIHKAASSILTRLEAPSADDQDNDQNGRSAAGAA